MNRLKEILKGCLDYRVVTPLLIIVFIESLFPSLSKKFASLIGLNGVSGGLFWSILLLALIGLYIVFLEKIAIHIYSEEEIDKILERYPSFKLNCGDKTKKQVLKEIYNQVFKLYIHYYDKFIIIGVLGSFVGAKVLLNDKGEGYQKLLNSSIWVYVPFVFFAIIDFYNQLKKLEENYKKIDKNSGNDKGLSIIKY